jgi:hypothetical protein
MKSTATKDVLRIDAGEAKRMFDSREPLVFIDARSGPSWDSSNRKLPGALRVPPEDCEKYLSSIPQGRTAIAYCT